MKTARKPTETPQRIGPPALSVNIDIAPLLEVVRRHVKLTPQATRLIKGEFAQLFQSPSISSTRKSATNKSEPATDPVLSTQEAADLVGVSRPYIVARIEAGDIPLHQQVGNQRRLLQSAVLAWHRREQIRGRKALGQLGADLDSEIFICTGCAQKEFPPSQLESAIDSHRQICFERAEAESKENEVILAWLSYEEEGALAC